MLQTLPKLDSLSFIFLRNELHLNLLKPTCLHAIPYIAPESLRYNGEIMV